MMKFFDEFKKFAFKGNLVDLAVGIVIGTAFAKMVESIVNNIINPIIGVFTFGQSLEHRNIKIFTAIFPVGNLLSSIIEFFLIAFILFIFVKFINQILSRKEKEKVDLNPTELQILIEIRDLLIKQNVKI